MNESASSGAYPWKKSVIHQPDLTGELYSPMFCLLGRPNPPALVIIPDDSGISDARERAYAAYFASRGLTCLIIDPFSPLDINQCVDNPRVLSLRELMAETCAAYSLLIVRRNINAVGIIGIGRGGLAAMHLGMSSVPGVPHFTERFDFIVSLSPTCYIQLRHPCPGRTPMLVIIASKDELCDPEQALAYTKRIQLANPEAVIKTSMLPEAHHAWDTTRLPRFNPDAIQLPRVTYYLEDNGTYTVDDGGRSWMPGEIVDFLAAKVHYGAHIGGGGAMFTAVCQTIDAFITRLKFFTCDQDADTGLQLLNRMDRRDDLLLRMGRCENLEQLFDLVSTTFGVMPETALVRIWLTEVPGDACAACHNRELCTNHAKCLHLVASGGHSIVSGEVWNNTDGDFSHVPYGVHKVGVIAATGSPLHVTNVTPDMPWVASPGWISREGIHTLLCQPLIHMKEVIGVIVLFSRGNYGDYIMDGLRIIADHLAIKIAHSRAFEELMRLKRQLEIENEYLHRTVDHTNFINGLVGESKAIQGIKEQIMTVAETDALVLIVGESGTGKELVASEIHKHSRYKNGPLVKVNCPTIPRELFESEFFGHVKGSFTGANSNHIGFFEAAENGTLFLDEIGEIEITQQSKLLRALQEKEYRRVGEEKNRSFHTRIVAATNRDLRAMVAAGTFREDLFYRLNVFPIRIPPLRERLEDIPLLVENFLRKYAAMFNRGPLRMKAGQMDKLMAHSWPGNIRELQNVIQRAVILSRGNTVSVDFLRITRPGDKPAPAPAPAPAPRMPADTLPIPSSVVHTERILTSDEMKDYIRGNFVRAMIKCNGKIFGENGAAALLDMKPTTLLARLRKLGIDKDHPA